MQNLARDPIGYLLAGVIVYATWWFLNSRNTTLGTVFIVIILLSVLMVWRVPFFNDLRKAGLIK